MKVELELRVPSSLSDIKLEDYQKYVNMVQEVSKNEDKENNENKENFISLKTLEIICGLKLKDSYKLPISVFDSVVKQVFDCLNENTPLIKRFWFKGSNGHEVEYGLIPDLHEMSFGEYVDLDTFITDWKNMHKAMAVLYRPITDKSKDLYLIEEYESALKYANNMKYMPSNVALGAVVFFYRLGSKLSNHMLQYIKKEMENNPPSEVERKFLEQNGVGINQFMQSLKGMSQDLTKSQKNLFTNV
tara:strand:+ start:4058 stop:4792 length:735 start_codon:yes stop_codon:yes gene_type:complete